MRRICCLCEAWASGGIESFLCNVLTRLDMKELEVDITAAKLSDSVFTEKLKAKGVRFFELTGNKTRIADNHRLFHSLLRERHYDVVHVNAFIGISLAYLRIAKEEGVPVRIAHSHNTALRECLTKPIKIASHNWAKRRYTKDATALWACSEDAAEFLFSAHELDSRGFQFIPNGIDVDRFRFDPEVRKSVRRELGLDGKRVIGHVGRLCYQKNQSFLLDVFAGVVKQRPDSVLLLLGEGEDRSLLEEKARRLGIAGKVLFYEFCEDVPKLYQAMDVFAFPSRFEGLGIAAVEAQAAGLPLVCSADVPNEARITEHVTVLKLENQDAWAEALSKQEERHADDNNAVAAAGFDVTDVASIIRNAYLTPNYRDRETKQ